MRSSTSIQPCFTMALVLAGILAASGPGATQTNEKLERFKATAVNVDRGAGETVEIVVRRWSTEAERDRLVAALVEKGESELSRVLQEAPSLGYVWTGESLGYYIRYAHRLPLPDGGERILVATDRRLGSWESEGWATSRQPSSIDYPFTLIELHLGRGGKGAGKTSLATKIAADQTNKAIVLENYGKSPLLLEAVTREQGVE